MRFLLDTCVVSDFIKGNKKVVSKLMASERQALAISSVSVMEIVFGLESNKSVKRRIGQALMEFIAQIHVEPFSRDCAFKAGIIRAELKAAGKPVGPFDLLIASTAAAHNYILVTSNERELSQIKGIKLMNWRT